MLVFEKGLVPLAGNTALLEHVGARTVIQAHLVGTWPTISWSACNYFIYFYSTAEGIVLQVLQCSVTSYIEMPIGLFLA